MTDQLAAFLWSGPVNALLLPIGVRFLPVLLTFCFRLIALDQQTETQRRSVWASYRGFSRFIVAITVAGWWVIWDLQGPGSKPLPNSGAYRLIA